MKVAFVALCLGFAAATVVVDAQSLNVLQNRAQRSERVVVGTIIEVNPVFDVNEFGDQLIISKVTLHVEEALKGPSGETLEVNVEGGTIGDLTLDVSDLPRVKRGERRVLFLTKGHRGTLVPNDRGSGILKLDGSNRVEGQDIDLDDVRRAVGSGGR